MPKALLHLLTFLSLAALCGAAEIPQLITDLSSDDYPSRYNARQQLKGVLAEASKPGSDPVQRAELEKQLLTGLQTAADKTARLWMLRMLEWFGSEASVSNLEGLLTDGDGDLRDAARRALAANPDEAAGKALRQALEGAPASEKPALIDALAYRGDASAAKMISGLLKSEDPHVADRAAEALGKLKSSKSLKKISAVYKKAPDARKPALERAMLAIGVKPALAEKLVETGSTPAIRAGAFNQLAEKDPKEALKILKARMTEIGGPVSPEWIRIAMNTPQPALRNGLRDMLPEVNPAYQETILVAVADLALSEYENSVLALLPDAPEEMRAAVFHALGVIGGETSAERLVEIYSASPSEAVAQTLARLEAPSLDARLFQDVKQSDEQEKRLAAVNLLALRNPKGAVNLFNELAGGEQEEALLTAVYQALESVGNLDSSRLLAEAVIRPGAMKKPAQKSLKKLCLNLGTPDALWDTAFAPALESAPDDAAREDLLAILDGVAGTKSLAYLEGILGDTEHVLRGSAIRSLSRWPDFAAGEVWLTLAGAEGASSEDLTAAQNGLIRIITQGSIAAPHKRKYALAVKAVQQGPNPSFKEAVLSRCAVPSKGRQKRDFEEAFTALLDDPDVGLKVYALLGRTPPPPPPEPEPKEEWETLVGAALEEHWTTQGGWVLQEGGVIHLPTQDYDHWRHYQNYLVLKDRMMADFELEFDWRTEKNSGIYFHIPDLSRVDGRQHVEVQIFDNNQLDPKKPLNDHAAGGIIPHLPPTKNTMKPSGEWNTFHIRCVDNQITVKLNGEVVNQANLNEGEAGKRSRSGGFAFQDHGYAVWLKNIRLKNLDPASK